MKTKVSYGVSDSASVNGEKKSVELCGVEMSEKVKEDMVYAPWLRDGTVIDIFNYPSPDNRKFIQCTVSNEGFSDSDFKYLKGERNIIVSIRDGMSMGFDSDGDACLVVPVLEPVSIDKN